MNPDVDKLIQFSIQKLATEIAPALADPFAQSQIGLMSVVLGFAAREYDRGVELRVRENEDMRRLFAECASGVDDKTLAARLKTAADARDESLKISALNNSNWDLRRLLIELQVHVESRSDDKARAMEKKIWALLQRMADARMIPLAGP